MKKGLSNQPDKLGGGGANGRPDKLSDQKSPPRMTPSQIPDWTGHSRWSCLSL